MNRHLLILAAGVALALGPGSPSPAATLRGEADDAVVAVGASTGVSVFLALETDEVVSLFEGVFDLDGVGQVASADLDLDILLDDWPNVAGNIGPDERARVSLTASGNRPGEFLVARLLLSATAPGSLRVLLDDGTFAAFDVPTPPFQELLDLTTPTGSELARIEVVPVPEPAPALLLLLGLAVFTRGTFPRGS